MDEWCCGLQDYGYQYNSMILLPTMCTIFIAVDPCHPQNGGLEVSSCDRPKEGLLLRHASS